MILSVLYANFGTTPAGFDGLLQHASHLAPRESARFRLRLAGDRLPPLLHGQDSQQLQPKGVASLRNPPSWPLQVSLLVPQKRRTRQTSQQVSRFTFFSLKQFTTHKSMMNVKLSLQMFWPCPENSLVWAFAFLLDWRIVNYFRMSEWLSKWFSWKDVGAKCRGSLIESSIFFLIKSLP